MPDRPPPPLAPIQHYRIQDWCGHDLYDCNDCLFDTMDADLMRQHQEVFHKRQATSMAADPRQATDQDKEMSK